MNKRKINTFPLKIAVLGHKTIPSRQGGIEIVVEELTVRMAKLGHKRLTDLCVERGITTNKLATLSGITQSTLNSMMRGETKNPKLKTLRKIAMGFNMTVSELLDFPEMNEMEFEDE